MAEWSSFIKFGRVGSSRSGEMSKPGGLLSASNCSSSKSTAISQNSPVTREESLINGGTVVSRLQRLKGLNGLKGLKGLKGLNQLNWLNGLRENAWTRRLI